MFVAESYANDNGYLLDHLLEMGSGTLTDELLTIGEEANRLLTDLSFHHPGHWSVHLPSLRPKQCVLCRTRIGLDHAG